LFITQVEETIMSDEYVKPLTAEDFAAARAAIDDILAAGPGEEESKAPLDEERPPEIQLPQQHTRRELTPAEDAEMRARIRAYRSNMLRALLRHFNLMAPFTSATAAAKTKKDPRAMANYLRTESEINGSRIVHQGAGWYFILDPLAGL
jgi:hypothetical protein